MLSRSRPRLSAFAALPLLLTLAALSVRSAVAQPGSPVLTVSVHAADTERPLPGALVSTASHGIQGTTDRNGMLRLSGLRPGLHTLHVRYLGYASGTADVQLTAGRAESVRMDLEVQPLQLAAVRVEGRRSLLETSGFNLRRRAGFGTFVTRDQIVRMQPRVLSDVLRRVAGIAMTSRPGGVSGARVRGTKVMMGSCPIQYYVDGTMAAYFNVDDVRPEDVEGLEIYRGAATIPPAYNKGTALCGVVVIWTRDQ